MATTEITKTTTPDEIEKIVDQLTAKLGQAGLPFERDRLVEDLSKRAAELNSQSVEDWRDSFSKTPAVKAAPRKKKAETPVDRESVRQRLKGAATKIDPDYFWMSEPNLAIGRTWIALRRDAGVVMNLMAVGPSGCGKTEGLFRLGREFNVPVYKIDCASITTPDKWSGHKEIVPTSEGTATQYVLSEHLLWLSAKDCEPGIVVYDEINRLPATLLNTLIPIMDGSQKIWVPDLGIYVPVHPDTMIAATANLGVGYSGTYGLDIALHDRFGVVMEQTFPPEEEEVLILTKRTGIDEPRAKQLVTVARQARMKANESTVSKFVSTRALIDWARWVTTGMSMTEAAEATWVKKFSEDGGSTSERATVRLIVQGVCAGN